ncbi:MAG: 16S rRNA (guanine(966)-N(2))-methyltransferase RsmD [Planctomycetota bacterium]
MKIIAGDFKNRRLLSPPGRGTRPITARVKERLFGRLGGRVTGAKVLDVFAGTGTIGLEAISRGAASAVFIERDRATAGLLAENVGRLGVADRTLVWQTDVFRCSFRPRDAAGLTPFGLVFFDPPYPDADALGRGRPLWKSLARVGKEGVTTPDAWLIVRVPADASPDLPAGWAARDVFRDGGMTLHEWQRVPPVEAV